MLLHYRACLQPGRQLEVLWWETRVCILGRRLRGFVLDKRQGKGALQEACQHAAESDEQLHWSDVQGECSETVR